MRRTIDDIVNTLIMGKDQNRTCTLLIGAGCSVKAGIPTAEGFVDFIKKKYPQTYKRAKEKTYPHCMAELAVGERRGIIASFVDKAKINWAHIGIAQLMKSRFVDRILTTNFDPLIIRACALIGVFPAVYDFAASQSFRPADIPEQAVFYLHGQRSGFILLNTNKECETLSEHLGPVFQDAGRGRTWLIIGYSGENDPVFDHLARVPRFDYNLYWIGYKDNEPSKHVRKELLVEGKYAYYVSGFDADDFFVTLSQRVGCFPPDFIGKPFTHLDNLLNMLTPYTLPEQYSDIDSTEKARELIKRAIEQEEIYISAMQAQSLLLAGDYEKVIDLSSKYKKRFPQDLIDPISWAYIMQGNALYEQAINKSGDEADKLFTMAGEKFKAALDIKPDDDEALNNWGLALYKQAINKSGDEADKFFTMAGEKFKAALDIKPDKHEALYNWGLALHEQAINKSGDEADKLFTMAREKYETALDIKPNDYEVLNNWGLALHEQAINKSGDEADKLFTMAGEKYKAALDIKPDDYEALDNWGLALHEQAKNQPDKEAIKFFDEAEKKFLKAENILPGISAYNLACLNALLGNKDKSRKWLDKSYQTMGLPPREYIENDKDLESVRDYDWFKGFLAKL